MTNSGGLQQSLEAMGFAEMGLALFALGCYSLMFNGALGIRPRVIAAACALLAAGVFIALTDPWMHGVILLVLGVAGIGLFVAAVWALSAVFGLTRRAVPLPASALASNGAPQETSAQSVLVQPNTSAHSA